jgi:TRAP transporter TAXI family solute receptor
MEGTPGSVYNLDALRNGDLEFGIVQSDVAYAAYKGEGVYTGKPFDELRSVMILYPELVTIMVRADSGIHQVVDLAGRRINVGLVGSGAFATWGAIEAALGWKGKAQITDLPADAASQALCAGEIDANLFVIGHPSVTVRKQLAACATSFVAVNGPQIDALVSDAPYLRKSSIPGALYGLAGDTPTISTDATVMTSSNEKPETVAIFAQALVAGIGDLRTRHPALAGLAVQEMVGGGGPVPLHPAADKVYKEIGLLN